MPLWYPLPRRPRHQGHIHKAFYWRSRLPFAKLQTLQMSLWHPLPRRPRHQGHIHSSLLAFKVCRLPSFKPSKCPFVTPYLAGQGTKATSIASYWHSRLPFPTLQTLQMSLWHPLPRRPRHQGHIHSFLLAFKAAICQASNPPNVTFGTPYLAGPRHQGHIHSFLLAFKAAVCKRFKPSKCPFGTPYLAGQGTKATSIKLFIGIQGCRLPGFKPSKCPFGTP